MTLEANGAAYRRNYPQTSQAIRRARLDVVEFAKRCGFVDQALSDIEVAVGEGLANAVEHGNDVDGGFDVAVRRDAWTLVVEIKDRGAGFDHGTVCARERPPHDALRGFGTFIMREFMDEIRYTEAGTRLQLRKRLPATTVDERSVARG
jgi:anti-sigma regulatory factor (Ser/Thr protein kinase)